MRRIIDDDKDKIVKMRKNNCSLKEICDETGLDKKRVSKFLCRNGLGYRGHFITEEDESVICDLYNSGYTIDAISNKYRVYNNCVIDILNRNGLDVLLEYNRHYTLNERYFDTIDTPNKSYILGLLYSDGNNCVSRHTVSIALQESDKEQLDMIAVEVGSNFPLTYIDYSLKKRCDDWNRKNQYRLNLNSKHLSDRLVEYGVIPNKTQNISYPYFLDDNLCSHFIRGVMDGDGCIPQGKQDRVVFTGCFDQLNGISEKLNNHLGFSGHLYPCKNRSSVTYNMFIYGRDNVEKYIKWIYSDAGQFLKRKHDICLSKYGDILNELANH